jgi:hypothetical protein
MEELDTLHIKAEAAAEPVVLAEPALAEAVVQIQLQVLQLHMLEAAAVEIIHLIAHILAVQVAVEEVLQAHLVLMV